jgi:SET domain
MFMQMRIGICCSLFSASTLLMPTSRTSWSPQKDTSARIHPFIGSTIRIMPSFSCSASDDEEKDEEDREMDTSETLAWRFMMKVMTALDLGRPIPPEEEIDIRLKIMCVRQQGIYLNKCRADPSTRPNAGWGVFATQDIEPNELITLYPVDAVIYRKAGQSADTIHFSPDISDHDSFAAFVNDSQAYMDYALLLDRGLRVIPDPAHRTDPVYLGHLINDYCAILCAEFQPLTDDEKEECLTNYDSLSLQNSNCIIKQGVGNCHQEIVATKFISAGSELFLRYGAGYWLRELGLAGLL